MGDDAKKQLPLRQQKDKPTLKYSNTTNGLPYHQTTAASGFAFNRGRPGSGTTQTEGSSRVYHGSYSCLSNDNILSSMYGSQYLSTQKPSVPKPAYAGYLFMTGPGTPSGMSLTPAQILAASIHTSAKVNNNNPYAQPITVTDLSQAETPVKQAAVVLNSASSNSSLSSNNSSNHGNQTQSNVSPSPVTLQTNSFMRPQSAAQTDVNANITKPTVTSKPAEKIDNVNSHNNMQPTVSHFHRSNSTEFLKTQPAPRPPTEMRPNSRPGSAAKPPAAMRPNSRPSSATRPQQHLSNMVHIQGTKKVAVPPATPMSQPNDKVLINSGANEAGRSRVSMATTSTPVSRTTTIAKTSSAPSPVNSFTDRFSSAQGRVTPSGQNSKTQQNNISGNQANKPAQVRTNAQISLSPSTSSRGNDIRVRNPNYTPARPYSEVSNPETPVPEPIENDQPNSPNKARQVLQPAGYKTNTPASTSIKQNPTVVTNNTNTKKPPLPSKKQDPGTPKEGFQSKVLLTHSTTGTVFYRKTSRAEEVIHDLKKRPSVEGAVSRLREGSGTSDDDDDDDEWITDEDEAADPDNEKTSERLPGDGEDNSKFGLDDDDDDDDDALDNLDEDVCGSDDESDTYSIATSLSSRRSSASLRVRSATKRLHKLSLADGAAPLRARSAKARPTSSVSRTSQGSDTEAQSALMPSLFPNVPPTVNFVIDGEKVETLPWEFRKLLKWRMSPITPNVVKNCIARSGFRATKKNHDWLGYWGKHMKAQGFKAIKEYQKINHFPGSFQIGRKDRLWRNLSKMQVHFGKKEFGFFPQTFILPFDMKQLKREWEDGGSKQKWIIKPPASARGIGIKVISKWNQIPKKRSVIVQRYLGRPYLINESKFDLRIYVYVTSYDPLRIYMYDDGLVRFASCKYSYAVKNINNKYMHLTNYSINKKNQEYESNTDENVCQGHKWGLKALWGYMKKQGINTNSVWENIKDLVIKTIISSESCVNSMVKANVRRRYCCHELFGFDVMLDENLKPWIIEVNISPSLHSNSPLDMNIKGGMIKDLFNISGFMLPDKNDVTLAGPIGPHDLSRYSPPNPVVIDKRLYPTQMSPDERAKHAYYCQRHLDEFVQQTILDSVTPDDLRILVETIDEDSRRGNFQRIFPNPTTYKFLRFFEQPRYYQLLLNQWVLKYHRMEARGIALLESLCARGVHLENPTDDPRHQWAPPSTTIPREIRPVGSAPLTAHTKSGSLPTLRRKNGGDSSSGVSRPPTAGSSTSMPAR